MPSIVEEIVEILTSPEGGVPSPAGLVEIAQALPYQARAA